MSVLSLGEMMQKIAFATAGLAIFGFAAAASAQTQIVVGSSELDTLTVGQTGIGSVPLFLSAVPADTEIFDFGAQVEVADPDGNFRFTSFTRPDDAQLLLPGVPVFPSLGDDIDPNDDGIGSLNGVEGAVLGFSTINLTGGGDVAEDGDVLAALNFEFTVTDEEQVFDLVFTEDTISLTFISPEVGEFPSSLVAGQVIVPAGVPVPEPATLALAGLAGLGLLRRRTA